MIVVRVHGDRAVRAMRRGARKGIKRGCEHLLAVSNDAVPLEEATLQRSGVADVDETELAGTVSYDTVYARRQHEELTWRHDPGRKAKYLEDALADEGATILDMIAAAVRRELEGGPR